MLNSVKETVLHAGSQGLAALAVVGEKVAQGGELLARGIHAAADGLDGLATGLPGPARHRADTIAAGVRYLGEALGATFATPMPSTLQSINFQAGVSAGTDAAVLAAGAASAVLPGHWVGSGVVMVYGLSRLLPGLAAKIADREDVQSSQALEAGKLIITTAATAALMPPVLAAGVYSAAMMVTARNADTLIKA